MFRKTTKNTTKPPELEMTPMIDIVFQLLAFFIITFRITALEGDFNILMPIQTSSPEDVPPLDQPVVVKISADSERNVSSVEMDGEILNPENPFDELNKKIASIANQPKDPTSEEQLVVEFVIDYKLRYIHTVEGVTAVVGKKMDDGTRIQYADQIKLRDQGARVD